MANDSAFNFELSANEEKESVLNKVNTVLGFFSLNGEELLPVFDKEALLGLCSFIDSAVGKHVEPIVKRIVESRKSKKSKQNTKVSKEEEEEESGKLDLELLKAVCDLLTNFTSYNESAVEFIKFPKLITKMSSLWFTKELEELLPVTVASLYNLSTSKIKRQALIATSPCTITEVVYFMNQLKSVENGEGLQYLNLYARFLTNMTVSRAVRRFMLNPSEYWLIQSIMKFLNPEYPREVRKTISDIIKHLCVDYIAHRYLLGSQVNILPVILLPLSGNEQFTDVEYLTMPDDLQYLPETKTREPDGEIRYNLLTALEALCRIKNNREEIRDANAYLVLRELHKFEQEEGLLTLVESIVDLLICTEEELADRKLTDPPLRYTSFEEWIKGTDTDDDEPELL